MKNILKLTLVAMFIMQNNDIMSLTQKNAAINPGSKASHASTGKTVKSSSSTKQYYCTFINRTSNPITLSFANNTKAEVPARGSYPMNVTNWSNLETVASDKSGKLLPSTSIGIGNYGYNTKAIIRTTDIKKTVSCPPPSPTTPMPQPCTTSTTKVRPTLSIVLDAAPQGFYKSKSAQ